MILDVVRPDSQWSRHRRDAIAAWNQQLDNGCWQVTLIDRGDNTPIPDANESHPLTDGQRIEFDRRIADFEAAWFQGKKPRIEDFLLPDRPVQLLTELVQIELELRLKAGEAAHTQEYLQRFPEIADHTDLAESLELSVQKWRLADETVLNRDLGHDASIDLNAPALPASPQGLSVSPAEIPASAELFIERLLASRLVSGDQLVERQKRLFADKPFSAAELGQDLIDAKLITSWQLAELQTGRTNFFFDQARYVLRQKIGQGGMGAVYRARHVRMGRDVALKVIDPRRVKDQDLIQRFRREMQVCSRLQHEHIVPAVDVGEHEGAAFLVMEFVEGADLASIVKQDGPMPADEAAAICLQAAAGLAYAHAQGIVHRDIKPQNILLSTTGVVKILDMGLARIVEDTSDDQHSSLTQEGAVMGTVDYMPPEQAVNSRTADARSDIYSLGSTLYYLLSARPPFPGGQVIEKLRRLALESPQPVGQIRPDCPQALTAIVEQMMDKHPDRRFQTAEDVVRVLQPLAATRLRGRAAITAAVQTAADTHRSGGSVWTSETERIVLSHESVLSTMRPGGTSRRRRGRVLAAVSGGALLVALFFLLLGRQPPKNPRKGSSDEKTPTVAVPAAGPQEWKRVLPGHRATVIAVAWSPDGNTLASGAEDAEVRIWLPHERKTTFTYLGHRAPIRYLAWSPDGQWLASLDDLRELHIHAPTSPVARWKLRPSESGEVSIAYPCFSPDGKELAYQEVQNGRFRFTRWSLATEKPVASIDWEYELGRPVYSPDGAYLAAGHSSGGQVWELASGRRVVDYQAPKERVPISGSIGMAAFLSPRHVVFCRSDGLSICDIDQHASVRELPFPVEARRNGIFGAYFSKRGGRGIVFVEGGYVLCDTEHGELQYVAQPLLSPITAGWSVTDNLQMLAMEKSYHLFVSPVAEPAAELVFPNNYFGVVAASRASPGMPRIAAGLRWVKFSRVSGFGEVLVDLETAELKTNVPSNSIVSDQGILRVIDGAVISDIPLPGATAAPNEGAVLDDSVGWTTFWTANGKRIAGHDAPTLGEPQKLRIWDPGSGQVEVTLDMPLAEPRNVPTRAFVSDDLVPCVFVESRAFYRWRGNAWERFSVNDLLSWHACMSPDEKLLALEIAHSAGKAVLFDLDRQIQAGTINAGAIAPVELDFSRSSRLLLVTREVWDVSKLPPTKLWECPDPDHGAMNLNHASWRSGVLFDDDRHVALMQDSQMLIFDWRKNEKLATLYLLPDSEWLFFNHRTGHYNSSPLAFKYMQCRREKPDGHSEWLSLSRFEKVSGWKNDPAKAGVQLKRDSVANN